MEYIEFGKIVNTHALRGEIKVYSYTDNEENILNLKKVYIDSCEFIVQGSRYLKGMFTFKLKGVDDINTAEKLVGKMIYREVTKAELNSETEFFVRDLKGLDVYDETNTLIGVLEDVFNTGANDVYQIKCVDSKTIYLPAIQQVIKSIDIKNRKMVVHIMEGLL
ncbi:MAG: 16S rRNA processing protein RimM [Clostridia bacterium]|nr:16S rRNA processing protein RimM [Clostridia bacterium]